MKKKNRIGEIRISYQGCKMELVEYNGCKNIIVEFQDEYKARIKARYDHFVEGVVKNPYYLSVYDVGFLGLGKYEPKKHKKIYEVWKKMLQRCYDPYYLNKRPTYIDCFVCKEWHNFQNFAKWYEENYYEIENEVMCLDKDILFKGNKIYSPQTCIFVPQRINSLFTKRQNYRGKYPIGVTKYNDYKLMVSISLGGCKEKNLGYFPIDKPFQAFTCYKNFKEKYIKEVADEYKDLIPIELYNAMYRYEVEIND